MAAPNRHLLDVDGCAWPELQRRVALAAAMRTILAQPAGQSQLLAAFPVATLFYEDSTRTRLSFERAAAALGAPLLRFSVAGSSVSKGESLIDTVRTLGALGARVIVLRHQRAGAPWLAARVFDGSILNAGDGWHAHPTQALLDLAVLLRRVASSDGSLAGRRIVIVGDLLHSRVVRSNLHTLVAAGALVRLTGPETLVAGFAEHAATFAGRRGSVTLYSTLDAALEGADAVMALRIQRERLAGSAISSADHYRREWGITESRLAASAAPGCVVLHPGPMNEGVEIDPDVADGPRSLVLEQVAEGVTTRMATLWAATQGLETPLADSPLQGTR